MPKVRGHFRNGTWVRSHYRRRPGNAGLGGMALAVAVLAVVGTLGAAGGITDTLDDHAATGTSP
jgi:hypothetical protein